MNTPEKCPKCGAGNGGEGWEFIYDCGSYFHLQQELIENKGECVRRQRDQLAERVKRLEEAADAMADAYEEIIFDRHDAGILEEYRKVRGEK